MELEVTNPELETFVQSEVRSGRFATPEAVVEHALECMMGDVGGLSDAELDAIDESEDQVERGEFRQWKEVSAELRKRYLGQ